MFLTLSLPLIALAQEIEKQWAEADHNYEIQDYRKAGEIYAHLLSTSKKAEADLLYNHANTLAKQEQWANAMKEYAEVLKKNPNHKAAKYNYIFAKNKLQDSTHQSQQADDDHQQSQPPQANPPKMDTQTAKDLLDALREQEIQMQKEINESRKIRNHSAKNW
jgi:Ca-activated chloride channel family protein